MEQNGRSRWCGGRSRRDSDGGVGLGQEKHEGMRSRMDGTGGVEEGAEGGSGWLWIEHAVG